MAILEKAVLLTYIEKYYPAARLKKGFLTFLDPIRI